MSGLKRKNVDEEREISIKKSDGSMCNILQSLRVELDHEFDRARHRADDLMYTAADQSMVPLAELLAQLSDSEAISYQDPKSEDNLLQKFNVPFADSLVNLSGEIDLKNQKSPQLSLRKVRSTSAACIEVACANGAKVNEQNLGGQTHLHVVLLGDIHNNRKNIENAVRFLLQSGADVNIADNSGNTPLLYLVNFLRSGAFEAATDFAKMLLEYNANPNAVNKEGRSLLTYSVSYLDDSVSLTRLLLVYGASVWSEDAKDTREWQSPVETGAKTSATPMDLSLSPGMVVPLRKEKLATTTAPAALVTSPQYSVPPAIIPSIVDQSAFSWFLKAVIHRRRLENCSQTLRLLSQVMGDSPRRMYAHVLRTMFRHVRCFRVLGPVFLQLKLSMMPYWSQPHDLKYLCWRTVRKTLGPRRLLPGTPHLGLPRPLQNYILME